MRQGGLSAIGFIIILLMIAFITMIALKLLPIYFENFKINSALRSLKEEPGISEKSNADIQNIMARRFNIDNIDRVKPGQIKVKRERSGMTIGVDYEVRDNFIGNIDVVVSFKDDIEISNR